MLRSDVAKKVKRGVSCVFKIWIQLFFLDACNFAMGVPIHFENSVMILRFRFGTAVADEIAQKSIWSVKGASANKPCMFCMNAVSVR